MQKSKLTNFFVLTFIAGFIAVGCSSNKDQVMANDTAITADAGTAASETPASEPVAPAPVTVADNSDSGNLGAVSSGNAR